MSITCFEPKTPFSFSPDGQHINIHVKANAEFAWGVDFQAGHGYFIFVKFKGEQERNTFDPATARRVADNLIQNLPRWPHALEVYQAMQDIAQHCEGLNLGLQGTGQKRISLLEYYDTGMVQ